MASKPPRARRRPESQYPQAWDQLGDAREHQPPAQPRGPARDAKASFRDASGKFKRNPGKRR